MEEPTTRPGPGRETRDYTPDEMARMERIIAETPMPEPEPAPEERELSLLTILQILLAGVWMALVATALLWLPEQIRQALQEGNPRGAILVAMPFSLATLLMLAAQMVLRSRINRAREWRNNRENMLAID